MILESAQGPNPSFIFFLGGGLLFNLGVCWDRGLDLDQAHVVRSVSLFNELVQDPDH